MEKMNQSNLKIYVIPSDVLLNSVEGYEPSVDGKVFSTMTDIKVNKIPDGYSILYLSDDIKNIDIDILGNNIIKLFMKNVPNTMIDICIEYLYEVNEYDEIYNKIDLPVVNNLLTLESKFFNISRDPNGVFRYHKTESMCKLVETIINNYKDIEDDDYDDIDEVEYTGSDNPVNDFFKSFGINFDDVDEDDDKEDDDVIGYKSKLGKGYSQSKILKESKNAKRAYNRHGVLICNNKKARKRDEKIIKEFLREFIPGNSEWKKEFRHDVLKRWMKMYSISKSDLKELEKAHNKAQKSKHSNDKVEKTLEFTSRLFNRTSDRWSDPNR